MNVAIIAVQIARGESGAWLKAETKLYRTGFRVSEIARRLCRCFRLVYYLLIVRERNAPGCAPAFLCLGGPMRACVSCTFAPRDSLPIFIFGERFLKPLPADGSLEEVN